MLRIFPTSAITPYEAMKEQIKKELCKFQEGYNQGFNHAVTLVMGLLSSSGIRVEKFTQSDELRDSLNKYHQKQAEKISPFEPDDEL